VISNAKVLANPNFLPEVCTPLVKNYRDTDPSGSSDLPCRSLFHKEYPDSRWKPGILADDYHDLVTNLSITIGVAVVASGIFAYVLSLVLVRPTKQVLSAIHQVEMGDFSARVSVWSQDEIGQMLKAFNNMIEELQVTQSALIHRNWQLTSVNELRNQ